MATKTAYPFRVEPQEVDFSLRITLVALGGNILNIAGIDAHTKGFGVDALNKDTSRGCFRASPSSSITVPRST